MEFHRLAASPDARWYAGRAASASPAVGSLGNHKLEQKQLIQDAFMLG